MDWLNEKSTGVAPADFFAELARPAVAEFVRKMNDNCVHWDKLRFQAMPNDISPRMAWAAICLSRSSQLQKLPLSFTDKRKFSYWLPPQHLEWISIIDQKAGGHLGTGYPDSIPENDEHYLYSSLMEEAIASSQLEGASTTREVAKEMLRTNRKPKSEAEQMIVNNYKAIQDIRYLKKDPLSPAMLCHLQELLTFKTLKDPSAAGRFRNADESVRVEDVRTGECLHDPPHADSIAARIQEICEFANTRSKPFVHPVVKAMALHFMLGFIHPFVDGNGRTARAVFYWHMLKHNYWLFEYLPISRVIVHAPAKYARAYLFTETDNGNLAYFNHYHLRVMMKALADLHAYLEGQQRQLKRAEQFLDLYPGLNLRQRTLIQQALKHPKAKYTVREHQGKFHVTYNTARSDLAKLENVGLLVKTKGVRKEGRGAKGWIYSAVPNLSRLLRESDKPERPTKTKQKKPVVATVTNSNKPAPSSLFELLDESGPSVE